MNLLLANLNSKTVTMLGEDISKQIAMNTASIASLKELIKTHTKEYQIAVAQIAENSQPEPMVQEVAIVSQHVHEEPVPVLHEYVQQSLDPEEPVPVLQDEPATASMEPMVDTNLDDNKVDSSTAYEAWRLKVKSL